MVHVLPRFRAASATILVSALVTGCVSSSDSRDDASRSHLDLVNLPRTDSPPLSHDTTPSYPDAGNVPLDAGSDLKLEPADADNSEASASTDTDTIPTPADAGQAPEAPAAPPVTVVVLPDTQYYASSYPDVFTLQTSWILQQKPILNIAAVLHVGDVVDNCNSVDQWRVAYSALRLLDGLVPYFLVPGNHDTDSNRNGLIDSYFGPASMPWITGTMTTGQIENNYALVDIGPQQWLVLGLEFGPRDAVMTWADTVLKAYPDRPAIIVTHAYLYSDGNRYDVAISGSDTTQPNYQYWIPQYYGYTASQGINDGEQIWQKLILPNPNVRLVFSGHVTGAARLTSKRPDGSRVHQMLSDYQWLNGDDFGYGYLRVLQFDYGKKTIQVQTYSPYMADYLTDDANQFTLDLNL